MEQILIALTGGIAILLSQQCENRFKKYAPIFGLLGQPFWFYSSYVNHQWGIFALTFFYTYAWSIGLYYQWIKKDLPMDKMFSDEEDDGLLQELFSITQKYNRGN